MSSDVRDLLLAASPPIPAPADGLGRAQGRAKTMRRRATVLRVLAVPLIAVMMAATVNVIRHESRVRVVPADQDEGSPSAVTSTTARTAASPEGDGDAAATPDGPEAPHRSTGPLPKAGDPGAPTRTLPSTGTMAFRRGDELWTMRLDGSAQRLVATVRSGFMGWSADGSKLLMHDSANDEFGQYERSRVRLYDLKTLTSRVVLDHPGHTIVGAAMSPDGRHYVYWAAQLFHPQPMPGDDTSEYLYITDADGRNARRLAVGRDATWSPDGQRLAYTCHHGHSWMCTIRVDGTGLRPIGAIFGPVSWSPDGQWIASLAVGTIKIYRPDGSGERDLRLRTYTRPLQWTPDSTRVVYAREVAKRDSLGRCQYPPCDEPPGIFATSIQDPTDHVRLTSGTDDSSPMVTFR